MIININTPISQTVSAQEIEKLAYLIIVNKGDIALADSPITIIPPEGMNPDMAGIVVRASSGNISIEGATEITDDTWNIIRDGMPLWLTKTFANYIPIEHLQSTGTQYIQTELSVYGGAKFIFEFQGITLPPTANSWGSFYTQGGNFRTVRFDNYEAWGYPTATKQAGINITYTNMSRVVFDGHRYERLTEEYYSLHNPNFDGCSTNWVSINMRVFGSSQIRLFQVFHSIYNDYGFNLIPAIRRADNVAGLYDLYNDKFYTNSGTGTFITSEKRYSLYEFYMLHKDEF